MVDVPRLQTESGQIAPTSPYAPSHSAWSSAPWRSLWFRNEPSNLLGSGPAQTDRPRQNNDDNNSRLNTCFCSIGKNRARDLNRRPLTPKAITIPTLPLVKHLLNNIMGIILLNYLFLCSMLHFRKEKLTNSM